MIKRALNKPLVDSSNLELRRAVCLIRVEETKNKSTEMNLSKKFATFLNLLIKQ